MSIDRHAVVGRHHPVITGIEPKAPLSLGNGSFGFSADITGLQSFQDAYEIPLGTQSHWGWHSTGGRDRYRLGDNRMQHLDTYGRKVPYPLYPEDREEAHHWLRQNPHRLQLGRIGFRLRNRNGEEAKVSDLNQILQKLNLWEGILYSSFEVEDRPVRVVTSCHPDTDQLAVRVESPLIETGDLEITVRFPAPDMTARGWDKSIFPDWDNDERHRSAVTAQTGRSALLQRTLDDDSYQVRLHWSAGTLDGSGAHEFVLRPSTEESRFACTFAFGPEAPEAFDAEEIEKHSKRGWEQFWLGGAAVDFGGSTDQRAPELERRVILSQYLTAIHSSGPIPPQETGLMYNSWFGKPHLEMHWWHAAQFPLWGRLELLARSLDWYVEILPLARELAESQGYRGARWPKMVGNDGKQSPSAIAAVLIWQQPHPTFMAELCYRADPQKETLVRWKEVVFEAADFMADYAVWDDSRKAYVLGPPLIPAQECHKPLDCINPPFELEYWKLGLEIALTWADRLGHSANPKWREVASSLAELPQKDGVYLAHENCPDSFEKYNRDHPSMLGALGLLPGALVDREVMKATLLKVKDVWNWQTAWGWDFPMAAMTAARLGEGHLAVDFLLLDVVKNTYLPNGHNYQRPGLMAYLPGNGGMLTAVAMMACGWQDGPGTDVPGFPKDGSWSVRWEGLKSIL